MSEPSPSWAEVALSVYELHGTSALNFVTSSAGIGGAYHVAVEVYGLEWSFGGADLGTGVYMVHIGESTLGRFHSRVPLGRTRKSPEQVFAILEEFRRTWRGEQYHLFAKNCAHFSIAFSKQLGFNNQPEWINALATVGAGLTGAQAEAAADSDDEDDLDRFDDAELEEFAEDGDHIALLELVFRRAKEYSLEWVDKQKADARFEDLLVEFRWRVQRNDKEGRNAALGILASRHLKTAIAEATGSALGLHWDRSRDKSSCPVQISRLDALSGLRVYAKMRVTGGDNMKRIRNKPSAEDFAARFKRAMKAAASWPQNQKAAMDALEVDTAPGQATVSHRVLTPSKKGGGEIYFPRREFTTPDSMQRTLGKLEDLKSKVTSHSAVHRTLNTMQHHEDLPWWASARA